MNVTEAKAKIREITNTNVNDYSEASLVRDLNSELAMLQVNILRDRGVLEFDDASFTNLPVAIIPLVAGQAAYKITVDENGNAVQTIHKVAILIGGTYRDVPRETVGEGNQDGLTDGTSADLPRSYYDIGQTVYLAQLPTNSGSMKVWFDRDVSQILTSDTTKELPLPRVYHNVACYKTSLNYGVDKGLSNVGTIAQRVQMEEEKLTQYEENRRGDEQRVMSVEVISGQ